MAEGLYTGHSSPPTLLGGGTVDTAGETVLSEDLLACEAKNCLHVPKLGSSMVPEITLQAHCLPQHLRRAAVDQSGLEVRAVLLLLLVVPWYQQLGEVAFQLHLLCCHLHELLQWLEGAV